MRKDTDPRYRPNAIIVFGGTGPWKSRLGVGDDRLAYLVLIDREGVVRWRYGGLFKPGDGCGTGRTIAGAARAIARHGRASLAAHAGVVLILSA